jgi:hypothetical protein
MTTSWNWNCLLVGERSQMDWEQCDPLSQPNNPRWKHFFFSLQFQQIFTELFNMGKFLYQRPLGEIYFRTLQKEMGLVLRKTATETP